MIGLMRDHQTRGAIEAAATGGPVRWAGQRDGRVGALGGPAR
jgi:hypothetical protein